MRAITKLCGLARKDTPSQICAGSRRPRLQRLMLLASLVATSHAVAATLYVDANLANGCATYDTASRACGNGASQAFSSAADGLGAVNPGDTLILRGGSYGQLNVQQSGTPAAPIRITGQTGESVVISSSDIGLRVINHSDVAFANLVVTNVLGFGRVENSTRIAFDSIAFSDAGASGTTGSLKFVRSSHNRVENSSFANGADLMIIQDASDFNVIEANTFGDASHSLISIRCSSQNVIRQNEFDNPSQKAMEIYDCEGISDAPVRLDDTKRNLLERNRFLGTAPSWAPHRYNAIQHSAQQTIVRLNVFTDNLGGGVNYPHYSQESLYVYENRLYNNTFYNNHCFAIVGKSAPPDMYYDNRVVNNLLFMNRDCEGENGQVSIEDASSVIFTNNSQLDSDPGFVDAAARNLELLATSDQIDAGVFTALAASSGSGTVLVVDDASWFYDGFGIAGESGDEIRLEGQSNPATIVAIDYATNAITLSTSLTWSAGDGVHLNYAGAAPDVGAFEFMLAQTPAGSRPKPPIILD